jgi:hypothetical protein
VPIDWQVGQTGKIVAFEPISPSASPARSSILAGMEGSRVIVAINKDEEPQIFQVADYGIVGDMFKLVPELVKELGSESPRRANIGLCRGLNCIATGPNAPGQTDAIQPFVASNHFSPKELRRNSIKRRTRAGVN